MTSTGGWDEEHLLTYLYLVLAKAEKLLMEAYVSTPPHISSRGEVYDALMLIRGALQKIAETGKANPNIPTAQIH